MVSDLGKSRCGDLNFPSVFSKPGALEVNINPANPNAAVGYQCIGPAGVGENGVGGGTGQVNAIEPGLWVLRVRADKVNAGVIQGYPRVVASICTYREGEEYVLSGVKTAVMDADTAHKLIVIARDDYKQWVFLVVDRDAEGVRLERMPLTDERSYFRVYFDQVRVAASERLDGSDDPQSALQRTLDVINIGLAAELYGMARTCFEQTVDYLQERHQFGVPIGSFQALQHRAAHMLTELEQAESVVRAALLALDEVDAGEMDRHQLSEIACAAKVKLSRVTHLVVTEAIQLHGGMGMTDELDIGFYINRARVAQQLFGDRQFHSDRYATLRGY